MANGHLFVPLGEFGHSEFEFELPSLKHRTVFSQDRKTVSETVDIVFGERFVGTFLLDLLQKGEHPLVTRLAGRGFFPVRATRGQ